MLQENMFKIINRKTNKEIQKQLQETLQRGYSTAE